MFKYTLIFLCIIFLTIGCSGQNVQKIEQKKAEKIALEKAKNLAKEIKSKEEPVTPDSLYVLRSIEDNRNGWEIYITSEEAEPKLDEVAVININHEGDVEDSVWLGK